MKNIVLLGDSLTAGWGLAEGENWSCQLASEYPNLSFTNCGVPGDTTTGMLSRFKSQVLEAKPDVVVLFGGLNDLNWGIDISVVASNLNSMIAQAQHHGIKPMLVVTSAIDPVGALPMFGNQPSNVERLRQSVETLSNAHSKKLKMMYGHGETGIEIVDAYQVFETYAQQNGYRDLYQDDGIHLSKMGAEIIFNKLNGVIAKI